MFTTVTSSSQRTNTALGTNGAYDKKHASAIIYLSFEQISLAHPDIEDAVAVCSEDTHVMTLCIKIKGGRASATCLDDVRQYLKDNLPHYVLPDKVVSIENMPITKHGKWHKKLDLEYVCCE